MIFCPEKRANHPLHLTAFPVDMKRRSAQAWWLVSSEVLLVTAAGETSHYTDNTKETIHT